MKKTEIKILMIGIIAIVSLVLLAVALETRLVEEKILFSFEKEEVENIFKIDDPENILVWQENGDFSFSRHKPTEEHEREM